MARSKREKEMLAPNDFLKQRLHLTDEDVPVFAPVKNKSHRRKPRVRIHEDFSTIAWKTWCQECEWHNRGKGKFSGNVIRNLAANYDASNIEAYVRAAFIAGVRHTYTEDFHFRFSHLANAKCEQAYHDYLEGYEQEIKKRKINALNEYNSWLRSRDVNELTGASFAPSNLIAKLLVALKKREESRLFLNRAAGDTSDDRILRLSELTARECMRWPGLWTSGLFDGWPSDYFIYLHEYLAQFRAQINGLQNTQ